MLLLELCRSAVFLRGSEGLRGGGLRGSVGLVLGLLGGGAWSGGGGGGGVGGGGGGGASRWRGSNIDCWGMSGKRTPPGAPPVNTTSS